MVTYLPEGWPRLLDRNRQVLLPGRYYRRITFDANLHPGYLWRVRDCNHLADTIRVDCYTLPSYRTFIESETAACLELIDLATDWFPIDIFQPWYELFEQNGIWFYPHYATAERLVVNVSGYCPRLELLGNPKNCVTIQVSAMHLHSITLLRREVILRSLLDQMLAGGAAPV